MAYERGVAGSVCAAAWRAPVDLLVLVSEARADGNAPTFVPVQVGPDPSRRRLKSCCPMASASWRGRTSRRRSWRPWSRRSARRADAVARGPDLPGDGRDGSATIDRRARRARARALHARSAVGPSVSVSQSPRRPAQDPGVGPLRLLGPLQTARARHLRVADGRADGARRDAQRGSGAVARRASTSRTRGGAAGTSASRDRVGRGKHGDRRGSYYAQ